MRIVSMGVRATVSHPLVALRMCEVSNVATRTLNHEMLQHQKHVKKNSCMWLRRLNMDEYSRVVHVTPDGLLTVPDAHGILGNSKIL